MASAVTSPLDRLAKRIERVPTVHRKEVEVFLQRKAAAGMRFNTLSDILSSLKALSLYVAAKDPKRPLARSARHVVPWLGEWRQRYKAADYYYSRIREFLKETNGGEVPTEIRDFKPVERRRDPMASPLLTPEEVLRLAEATRTHGDRTAVLLTYYGAFRVHEAAVLTVGAVEFDTVGGANVTLPATDGRTLKTGSRTVWVYEPVPDLKIHLNRLRDTRPDAPLFPGLNPRKFRDILLAAAKKAELEKRANPHALRKARITFLAGEGVPESDLRTFAGWTLGSEMVSVYVLRSGGDMRRKLQRLAGLPVEEARGNGNAAPRPRKCPDLTCGVEAPVGAKFCPSCASPLDVETARRLKENMAPREKIAAHVMEKGPLTLESLKEELRVQILGDLRRELVGSSTGQ